MRFLLLIYYFEINKNSNYLIFNAVNKSLNIIKVKVKHKLMQDSSGKDKNDKSGQNSKPGFNRDRQKPYRKRYHNRQKSYKKDNPQAQTGPREDNKALNLNNQSVSIIVPLLNEEESLKELAGLLENVLGAMNCNYEVIFVDDGSTDKSFDKIRELNAANKRFKCIKFRKNYGKSAALSAGFKEAKGNFVITMDADLQDDPREIPDLIKVLQSGYDLVSGWKKVRYDPFIKRNTSKIFNFVTSKVSGVRLHDFNCGLKAYRKDVVKSLKVYGEMHRYLPALAHLSGFKVTEKIVKHHPRKFGKTKYGASRFINGFLDVLTVMFTNKYIKKPLHLFGMLGLLSGSAGFVIIAYLTLMKFLEGEYISNRPLFIAGVLLAIVGVQFFSLGLIAEMITKTNASQEDFLIEKIL